ncbi:hypothetical protein [Patulibacter minatonensis]|uniref:hypothetical protein n=1 Tax=Patulibacter minatonensis TaxID=298163 RepID=UPI0004B4AC02|nr:hypothetical protein [Patulibacter minatonensis]
MRKKLKTASFAAAVDRDDVTQGAEEIGVDLAELITTIVDALEPLADELGIAGQEAG